MYPSTAQAVESNRDDETIARALQEEEDAEEIRQAQLDVQSIEVARGIAAASAAPPLMLRERDLQRVSARRLNHKRWLIGMLTLLEMCGLILLLLQRTGDGFPRSVDAFAQRWGSALTQEAWFAPLVVSLALPIVGTVGAIRSIRWLLWVYVAYLFVAVGACSCPPRLGSARLILPYIILYGMHCNKGLSGGNTILRNSVGHGWGSGVPKQGGWLRIIVMILIQRSRTK